MQGWVDLGGILLENSFCQNILLYDILLDSDKSIHIYICNHTNIILIHSDMTSRDQNFYKSNEQIKTFELNQIFKYYLLALL